uniref:Nucleolar protein 6 n=1 Tax=Aegilops tauschii TaxID=37682 RepID=M8B632_AEGTA
MVSAEYSIDLKLSELLKQARPSATSLRAAGEATDAVGELIQGVPPQQAAAEAASGFVRDLGLAAEKLAFSFRPPEVVRLAGSHAAGAVTRPDVAADLLVRLPKECFHEKDFLNHRYHAKRCLYLCVIEKSLRSSPLIRKVSWSTFQDEARKPVLHVYPATEIAELPGFYVRIIPTASSLFDLSKLNLSTRNNVRAYTKDGINQPTPRYNNSILEDMFLEENAEYTGSTFANWKTLQEALVLLKCSRSLLIGFLLDGNLIFSLKCSNFEDVVEGLGDSANEEAYYQQRVLIICGGIAHLLKTFDVAICDVSGHVNLAFRMTKSAFSESPSYTESFLIQLQDEAACTLNCLDKCRDGGFEELFMTKVDFGAKFDSCLSLSWGDPELKMHQHAVIIISMKKAFPKVAVVQENVWRINLKGNSKVTALSFCSDDESWRVLEKDVQSLLQQGLTDRTKMIRVLWRSTPSEWNIMDGFSEFGSSPLIVGVMLSLLEKSYSLVDIGPNPENRDEAIKFRKFWGEKAELRRFKDGAIAESTVWETETWERHTIIKRIADYVLSKHLLLRQEDLTHVVDQLDFCLLVGGQDPVSSSGALLEAFDTLAKQLRLLDDVPLKISTVQPLDSAFRHTSVFPPEPHPLAYEKSSQRLPNFAATCVRSLEVMIQLEGSGNWPLDPVAMEKTKSAFLLRIGERFLRLLSSFDWTFSPMIVDINNDFNLKDEKEINVCPLVLKRIASYAKSSAELLTNLIIHGQSGQYTWEKLDEIQLVSCILDANNFRNNLAGKLVIQGKPSNDFHPYMPLSKSVVRSLHDTRDKLLVNFDPTAYFLRDLKCAFPVTFKLWHDSIGGDAIGLTWESSKVVAYPRYKRGRDEDDEAMLDPTSILKEVGDVGKGLVRSVHLLKAPKLE